jgi:hypothetical protein
MNDDSLFEIRAQILVLSCKTAVYDSQELGEDVVSVHSLCLLSLDLFRLCGQPQPDGINL